MRKLRISAYCKTLFLFVLFSLSIITGRAQTYNNEWIVPNQTYYKFKIPADGLYRLTAASLAGQAILSSPASYFQLWRNGKQVPIYASTGGILSGSAYIEFWGEHNDGKVDASLFQKPEDQLNKARSFEGDSSTYFLTINTTTSENLRYIPGTNDAATKASGMTALPYFMYTTQQDLGSGF